ncbi:MAG: hypothetical protein LBM07_06315 [Culturomica sp.]|jgi:opacity protein-like surface antigen|nr:hypothetical protein [Culturomica sp.]
MKKLLLCLATALIATTASAQLVQSTTVTRVAKKTNDSGMFLELSAGSMKVEAEYEGINLKAKVPGTALGLGLGYRRVFTEYVAWDIFGLNALSSTEDIGSYLYLQGITAVRGTSPELFAGMTAFASAGVGYGHVIDGDGGGLAFDIKIGINLTPRVNLAFRYNSQSLPDDTSAKVSAFNLGFKF